MVAEAQNIVTLKLAVPEYDPPVVGVVPSLMASTEYTCALYLVLLFVG